MEGVKEKNRSKMKAIDNSNGHESYWMTQAAENIWSVRVPKSAYNIAFNRYSSDETTQWNSWSAGGRDENNAYYAEGSEYGHWGCYADSEMYFHEGDMIYLDVSEFTDWEKDDAFMYVNFTDASKEENGGNDVSIANADKTRYNPKKVADKSEDYIYPYVVTKEEEGATELRFWRGNGETLWNCSVVLSYEDYETGNNCIKISQWNNSGVIIQKENNLELDSDGDGISDYNEIIFGSNKKKIDSDDDGLDDYYEIYISETDPIEANSIISLLLKLRT